MHWSIQAYKYKFIQKRKQASNNNSPTTIFKKFITNAVKSYA